MVFTCGRVDIRLVVTATAQKQKRHQIALHHEIKLLLCGIVSEYTVDVARGACDVSPNLFLVHDSYAAKYHPHRVWCVRGISFVLATERRMLSSPIGVKHMLYLYFDTRIYCSHLSKSWNNPPRKINRNQSSLQNSVPTMMNRQGSPPQDTVPKIVTSNI